VKNILVLVILAALAWYGYGKYKSIHGSAVRTELSPASESSQAQPAGTTPSSSPSQFTCDGRTHCSAMTSCAEAKYFIQHCPNTKMDGNNDGVPCEKQWCN
jgi:hypothetical protein